MGNWFATETTEKPRAVAILVPHAACVREMGTATMDAERTAATVDMLNHLLSILPSSVRSVDARALIAALELKLAIMRLAPEVHVHMFVNETTALDRSSDAMFAVDLGTNLPRLCAEKYVAVAVEMRSFATRGGPLDVLMPRGHGVPANVYFKTRTGAEMTTLDAHALAFEEHRCLSKQELPRMLPRKFGVRCVAAFFDEDLGMYPPRALAADVAVLARWCVDRARVSIYG